MLISDICSRLNVDGLRGDIVVNRAAKALVAFEGRSEVQTKDIERIISLCLNHRCAWVQGSVPSLLQRRFPPCCRNCYCGLGTAQKQNVMLSPACMDCLGHACFALLTPSLHPPLTPRNISQAAQGPP